MIHGSRESLLCCDGVVVVLTFVVLVFVTLEAVEFGKSILAGLGNNCCVG